MNDILRPAFHLRNKRLFITRDVFLKFWSLNGIYLVINLVWFYGISTTIGYLMLNPVYTYLSNTYYL